MGTLQSAIDNVWFERELSEDLVVTSAAMQGCRFNMEDTHTIVLSLPSHPGTSLIAVFDGHSGYAASLHLKRVMHKRIDALKILNKESLRELCIKLDIEFGQTDKKTSGSTIIFIILEKLPDGFDESLQKETINGEENVKVGEVANQSNAPKIVEQKIAKDDGMVDESMKKEGDEQSPNMDKKKQENGIDEKPENNTAGEASNNSLGAVASDPSAGGEASNNSLGVEISCPAAGDEAADSGSGGEAFNSCSDGETPNLDVSGLASNSDPGVTGTSLNVGVETSKDEAGSKEADMESNGENKEGGQKQKKWKAIIGWVGDSRAIASNSRINLTQDHKALNPMELKRINEAGGFVSDSNRVNGTLAMSRAFGDWNLKNSAVADKNDVNDPGYEKMKVICVPEFKELILKEGEWCLLMCDGLVELLSNSDIYDVCSKELELNADDPDIVLSLLLDVAVESGSKDNMTAVLIQMKDGTPLFERDRPRHSTLRPGHLMKNLLARRFRETWITNCNAFGFANPMENTSLLRACYRYELLRAPESVRKNRLRDSLDALGSEVDAIFDIAKPTENNPDTQFILPAHLPNWELSSPPPAPVTLPQRRSGYHPLLLKPGPMYIMDKFQSISDENEDDIDEDDDSSTMSEDATDLTIVKEPVVNPGGGQSPNPKKTKKRRLYKGNKMMINPFPEKLDAVNHDLMEGAKDEKVVKLCPSDEEMMNELWEKMV